MCVLARGGRFEARSVIVNLKGLLLFRGMHPRDGLITHYVTTFHLSYV